MNDLSKYDVIRPYTDQEAQQIFPQLARNPWMHQFCRFIDPDKNEQEIISQISSFTGTDDFVQQVSYFAIRKIIERSTSGLSFDGVENLDPQKTYLFISNHRDIVLDASILNLLLYENHRPMAESAIGDNLVKNEFLMHISRLNYNFVVYRDLSLRETLQSSMLLSEYINFVLNRKDKSVWIAQREGRTKDGNDQTQVGVLKMIGMAAEGDLADYFKSLRVVPVAISYEYDPTAQLKLPQLMAHERGETYVKSEGEDFNTIMTGIKGFKGGVHISVGKVLDQELEELRALSRPAKQLKRLSEMIDECVYRHYKLWPSNYVAYDMLHQTQKYGDKYTPQDVENFRNYVFQGKKEYEEPLVRTKLLKMYAMPVMNNYSFR